MGIAHEDPDLRGFCGGADGALGARFTRNQPRLAEALERAMAAGVPYVILDGKVFETDRCSEAITSVKGEQIGAWDSGKARRHGGNVQAVMRPDGLPLWAGPAEPGSVHDITAARWHALPVLYRAAALGMPALADSGYEGARIGILIPVKNPPGNRELDLGTRTRNALLRDLRCGGNAGSPAHPALGHPPARHRQSQQNHRDNPRRPRPHPIRAQVPHLKFGEITSLRLRRKPPKALRTGPNWARRFLRSRSDRQRWWGAGPAGQARPRTPAGQRHRKERRCYPVPVPRGRAPLPSYGAPVQATSLRPLGPLTPLNMTRRKQTLDRRLSGTPSHQPASARGSSPTTQTSGAVRIC